MIAENPLLPAFFGERGLVLIDQCCYRSRIPRCSEETEVEWQVHALQIAAVVDHEPLDRKINFSNKNTLTEFLGHLPHFGDDVVDLRPIRRVQWNDSVM